MVEVRGHPPQRVVDAETCCLALDVGEDHVPKGHIVDHDVDGPATRVIRNRIGAHATDGTHTGVGGDDVGRKGFGIGNQTAHPDCGDGVYQAQSFHDRRRRGLRPLLGGGKQYIAGLGLVDLGLQLRLLAPQVRPQAGGLVGSGLRLCRGHCRGGRGDLGFLVNPAMALHLLGHLDGHDPLDGQLVDQVGR